MDLTESDFESIVNHLRVAADVYREDAKRERADGHEHLAQLFDRQVVDANRIADQIEIG